MFADARLVRQLVRIAVEHLGTSDLARLMSHLPLFSESQIKQALAEIAAERTEPK